MFIKIFIIIFVFLIASVSLKGSLEKYGPFEIVLYSHLLKCNHNKSLNLDVNDIGVHFHDFSRNIEVTSPIRMAAENILHMNDLEVNRQWIVFVPGFNSPMDGNNNQIMKEAFRSLDDIYYLVIDHCLYTSVTEGYLKAYEKSTEYAYDIAKAVARFIAELYKGGIPIDAIRCIGHSLGGQILGYTGTLFKQDTGISIKRITGLDPAGPCFANSFIEDQLRSGAAEYVEVFHCNAYGYGTPSILGDVDYLANDKGEWQPTCHVPLIPGIQDSPRAAKCSHEMCIKIYAASVYHRDWYPAVKCDSYEKFKKDQCSEDEAQAGFWGPGTARGLYYFSTKDFNIEE